MCRDRLVCYFGTQYPITMHFVVYADSKSTIDVLRALISSHLLVRAVTFYWVPGPVSVVKWVDAAARSVFRQTLAVALPHFDYVAELGEAVKITWKKRWSEMP